MTMSKINYYMIHLFLNYIIYYHLFNELMIINLNFNYFFSDYLLHHYFFYLMNFLAIRMEIQLILMLNLDHLFVFSQFYTHCLPQYNLYLFILSFLNYFNMHIYSYLYFMFCHCLNYFISKVNLQIFECYLCFISSQFFILSYHFNYVIFYF